MFSGIGPPLDNLAGPCSSNYAITPMTGTGGLILGTHQSDDVNYPLGNGYEGIVQAFRFFFTYVYLNTNVTDYQSIALGTPTDVVAPTLDVDASGNVTGDIRAWDVSWNGSNFNQGSPKPDGTYPSYFEHGTVPVAGTYDNAMGAYKISWDSLIVGGPFTGYTGHWQLAGLLPAGQLNTPTPVPSITNTPTDTPTPTNTPVPGVTNTPTDTPSPGVTNSPTDTPTSTPTVSASSSSSSGGCGGMIDPGSSGGPRTPPGNAVAILVSLFLPMIWILGRKSYRYWAQ